MMYLRLDERSITRWYESPCGLVLYNILMLHMTFDVHSKDAASPLASLRDSLQRIGVIQVEIIETSAKHV